MLLFGGAAETGLNSHPRKISNAIHWLLLNLSGTPPSLTSSFSGELPIIASPEGPASDFPTAGHEADAPTKRSQEPQSSPEIVFKCFHGNDIRLLTSSNSTKLSKLMRKVQKEYDEPGPLVLKYTDEDGDLVSLSRTSDLKTAIRIHERSKSSTVKLHIFSLAPKGSATSATDALPDNPSETHSSGGSRVILGEDSLDKLHESYMWHIPFAELDLKNVLGKVQTIAVEPRGT